MTPAAPVCRRLGPIGPSFATAVAAHGAERSNRHVLSCGKLGAGSTRHLAVLACALGALFALPVSASAAKVIDVPATPVFLSGNTSPASCQAFLYLQWPEQANAVAWEVDYEYLSGTVKHRQVTVFPPFDDNRSASRGWFPPAGTHWHYVTYRAKSAPGRESECASYEAEMIGNVISATVHVTLSADAEKEEEEKEKETKEKEKKEREEKKKKKEREENPPGKKGKATCRGKTATIVAQSGRAVTGTRHRDVIIGTSKRDVIRALGGNDLVCGLGGNDIILGGSGRDVLLGQGGNDTLRGQEDKDVLFGGNGADRLFGQASADRLFGEAGADALNGGAGRPDLCNGGPGKDQRKSPGCERRQQIP